MLRNREEQRISNHQRIVIRPLFLREVRVTKTRGFSPLSSRRSAVFYLEIAVFGGLRYICRRTPGKTEEVCTCVAWFLSFWAWLWWPAWDSWLREPKLRSTP